MDIKACARCPIGQGGIIGGPQPSETAACIRNTVVVAETVAGFALETKHIAVGFIDDKIVVQIEVRPAFLDDDAAAIGRTAAFDGIVHEIDMAAIDVIQVAAPAAADIADEVDHVVADNDRFLMRAHRGSRLEHGGIVAVARHVHHIVFDDAAVTDAQQVDGVVVGEHVVGVVCDGVASDDRMVSEGNVNALERLVGEGAVFDQKPVVERVDVVALVIQADIAVFEMTADKFVIGINPISRETIDDGFVVVEAGV